MADVEPVLAHLHQPVADGMAETRGGRYRLKG